jgi:hypothetical protein
LSSIGFSNNNWFLQTEKQTQENDAKSKSNLQLLAHNLFQKDNTSIQCFLFGESKEPVQVLKQELKVIKLTLTTKPNWSDDGTLFSKKASHLMENRK